MSEGFFSLGLPSIPEEPVIRRASFLNKDCSNCTLGPASLGLQGEGHKKILIIGEWPSETEIEKGTYWSGRSGRLFWDTMKRLKINPNKDCWMIHACGCGQSKNPSAVQLNQCRPRLL
jgi:uracil-DNA glycosylase